jgi:signal transduction histidine kinase
VSARRLIKNRALAGFQVSARDVTEQKRLREIVLETERLAAICQLGIAVRHEINNPLTTVIGNTELLLEQYDRADDDLKKRLEVVLDNALRIAEIVKRLEGIRKDNVVEYLQGVKMTDLKQE